MVNQANILNVVEWSKVDQDSIIDDWEMIDVYVWITTMTKTIMTIHFPFFSHKKENFIPTS
jgi:hypothetical protein